MSTEKRLLVFDCHEAWVYQLRLLDRPLDIIVGLRGRPTTGWDEAMRPAPPNARMVRLEDVLRAPETYDCIIAHNLTDLLDAKTLPGPRLLVIHETIEGALLEHGSAIAPRDFRRTMATYINMTGTHVVASSSLKGRSAGFEEDIVPFSADPADYLPWEGDLARGLRVSNHVERRPRILLWEFHRKAFQGLPVTLVGRNPGMEGVRPSSNWQELKEIFRRHRFYIHTADPQLEDGYNLATIEAMAAGLPVLGNLHPTSPVKHGVSGFLSDDPAELRGYAEIPLQDRQLARRMGAAARETVLQNFSGAQFARDFSRSVEIAKRKWSQHRARQTAPSITPNSHSR